MFLLRRAILSNKKRRRRDPDEDDIEHDYDRHQRQQVNKKAKKEHDEMEHELEEYMTDLRANMPGFPAYKRGWCWCGLHLKTVSFVDPVTPQLTPTPPPGSCARIMFSTRS
jgi:hypothetical protein